MKRIDELDWPRCAICDMPVQNFYVLDTTTGSGLELVAECHGDRQVVTISEFILANSKIETMELGPAFTEGQDKLYAQQW